MIRRKAKMVVRRMTNPELYHHGKEGQKWGVMHGPPYPLDKSASVQAKKKKKSLITKMKDKRKGKKLQKAREAKRQERIEKEKVINSGDAQAVKKIANKLTDEEMARALTKIQFNDSLNSYIAGANQAKAKKGQSYLETASTTMQTIGSMARAAGDVYNTLERVGVVKKDDGLSTQYKKNLKLYQEKALEEQLKILNGGNTEQIIKVLAMNSNKKK